MSTETGDLYTLRAQLQAIYDSISRFQPPPKRLPILDSSLYFKDEKDQGPWIQHENIPGLKKLKETVKIDLDALDKFLSKNPSSAQISSLCTNAPYLIAVWNQVQCAPPPVQIVFKSFSTEPEQERDDALVDENAALTEQEQRERREQKKARKGKDKEEKEREQKSPGVKVDVVADYGRRWIRVNTIKNSRILAEFREIDSYFTDSEDSSPSDTDDPDYRPSLAPKEFDNSLLRMGRALMTAAKANPVKIPVFSNSDKDTSSISFKTHTPRVTLRLTRLDPAGEHGPTDSRIEKTIKMLEEMGLEVELGPLGSVPASVRNASSSTSSRDDPTPAAGPSASPTIKTTATTILSFQQPTPTHRVNLDLSILLALVSDLTHAPLPESIEEAKKRFAVEEGGRYVEWKKAMAAATAKESQREKAEVDGGKENGTGKHKANKKTKGKPKKKGAKARAGVVQEDEDDIHSDPDSERESSSGQSDDELDAEPSQNNDPDLPPNPIPYITDIAKQTRALTNQVLQEMTRGLLEEMRGRLGLDPLSVPTVAVPTSSPAHHSNSSPPPDIAPGNNRGFQEKKGSQNDGSEGNDAPTAVEFWTTPEARDRCLRIVEKIGGPGERRRARALLWIPSSTVRTGENDSDKTAGQEEEHPGTLSQAEEAYWRDSRYGHKYLPLLPIRFYPCDSVEEFSSSSSFSTTDPDTDSTPTPTRIENSPSFFLALDKACSDTLEQETAKGRWYTKYRGFNYKEDLATGRAETVPATTSTTDSTSATPNGTSTSAPRTILTKVNPRLTPHTVQSLRWGARLGWTTLTANRTSVRAIVKEVGARRRVGEVLLGAGAKAETGNTKEKGDREEGELKGEDGDKKRAAIWIVDPRSLAEGMRADLDSFHLVEG